MVLDKDKLAVTEPGTQVFPAHNKASPTIAIELPFALLVVTSKRSLILARDILENTLKFEKYRLEVSLTLAVVRNGSNAAKDKVRLALALAPPMPDCENIRALVILFPEFLSNIYNYPYLDTK